MRVIAIRLDLTMAIIQRGEIRATFMDTNKLYLITPQVKFNLSSRWGMGGVLRAT